MIVSAGLDVTLSCRVTAFVTPPAVAVIVAVWDVLTAEIFAAKLVVVAPAPTVTDAGTLTEVLLLESAILTPPVGAAPVSVTAQESVADPVIEPLAHVRPLSAGVEVTPVPLRLTSEVPPVDELLAIAS